MRNERPPRPNEDRGKRWNAEFHCQCKQFIVTLLRRLHRGGSRGNLADPLSSDRRSRWQDVRRGRRRLPVAC